MYLAAYKKFDKHPSTTYHPELEDEIWDGVISIDLYQPTGPEWEAFSQAVIDELRDPIWEPYISQPSNTSSVDYFAGNLYCKMSLNIFTIILKCMYTWGRRSKHW